MEYKELDVWKAAIELAKLVYQFTLQLPSNEELGLSTQMKRAAVSIPSNIAEGLGRNHYKDTIPFLFIARGSIYDLETQLMLCIEIFKIDKIEFDKLWDKLQNCKMLINGFINYFQKRSNNGI